MFIDPKLARRAQLAEILEEMCQAIELSATQADQAEQRYGAVGGWLADAPPLAGASIYVHGSVALGTTVKPPARAEFDVDLVCFIPGLTPATRPTDVKKLIGDRLKAHETYRRLVEEKRRCWRLNYANEFHMDITPAIRNPDCAHGGELVPDKELREWKPTNPKGYRRLFEHRASLQPMFRLLKRAGLRADIEPYPPQMTVKGILRRAVQICKRHRDIYFAQRRSEQAPISIIITTLAARSYEWCIQNQVFDDEIALLMAVVELMPHFIAFEGNAWVIPNETTLGENFAEKWNADPALAEAFFEWHRACVADLGELLELVGRDRIQKRLGEAFGASAASKAMLPLVERISANRGGGTLAVIPGLGLRAGAPPAAGTLVRSNTFFGAG